MAWDDPVVWVLIIAAIIFLFGSNKIPELARALGQARKQFDEARSGFTSAVKAEINAVTPVPKTNAVNAPAALPGSQQLPKPLAPTNTLPAETATQEQNKPPTPPDDPLLIAARNEGIDTRGKSRADIAQELAKKIKS